MQRRRIYGDIPVLPYLSDSEKNLAEMIRTAKEHKTDFVFVGSLNRRICGFGFAFGYAQTVARNCPNHICRKC